MELASQSADLIKILVTHGSEQNATTPLDIDTRVKILKKTLSYLGITKYELATCQSFDPQNASACIDKAMKEFNITKDKTITWTGNQATYGIIQEL